MTINLASASIKSSGSTTTRALGDRYAEVINVKDYGAVGDGSHDDTTNIQAAIDAAFGSAASPHGGSNYTANKPLFFPNGHYKTTSSLNLTGVQGAHIYGAGRFTTTIENAAGGNVFTTNGFQYSRVEMLHLKTSGTGVCFDLNYDGLGTWSVSCQSNTFSDCFFEAGAYGVRIANGGGTAQGSENLFLNCFWISQTTAGLTVLGSNAVDNSVIGGDFQGCAIGIDIGTGGIEVIHGVSFQNLTGTDINTSSNVSEIMSIAGCRTESANFFQNSGGINSVISGCGQVDAGLGNGVFAFMSGGHHHITGSQSAVGQVTSQYWANITISDSWFNRADWLTTNGMWYPGNNARIGSVEITNVSVGNILGGIVTQHIKSQRLFCNDAGTVLTRTYGVEGAALTDTTVMAAGGTSTVTISNASPGVIDTSASNGFTANLPVYFTTTGGLPTGLSTNTVYYVKTLITNHSFSVSATPGGAAINTSSAGSGVHSINVARTYAIGDTITKNTVAAGGSPGWVCTTAGESSGLSGAGGVFKAIANIAA